MVKEEWDADEEIYLICRPKVWKANHSQTKVNKLLATVLGSSMHKDHPCLNYIRQWKNWEPGIVHWYVHVGGRYLKYGAPDIVSTGAYLLKARYMRHGVKVAEFPKLALKTWYIT